MDALVGLEVRGTFGREGVEKVVSCWIGVEVGKIDE